MLTIQEKGVYLLVEVSKSSPREEILSVIDRIPAACEQAGTYKVLLDVSRSDTEFSILDRYEIGKQAAQKWGNRIVVAGIAQEKLANHMAETVGTNRGGRMRVFTDRKQALAWLGIEDMPAQ